MALKENSAKQPLAELEGNGSSTCLYFSVRFPEGKTSVTACYSSQRNNWQFPAVTV